MSKCINIIEDCFGCDTFVYITITVILVFPWLLFKVVIYWTSLSVIYHTIMFPFHILVLPASICFFKLNFLSFCGFPIALFFGYSYFFPNFIDDFLLAIWFQYGDVLFKFPSTNSFEIQPQNKMNFLPFLIPRKRTCFFYAWSLIFEVFFSLIFMTFIKNWG